MVESLNEGLDFGIFYDGKNVKQADMKIGVRQQVGVEGAGNYYFTTPVIKFGVDTEYVPFGSFFNQENFGTVVTAFQELVGEYKQLLK